MQSRYPQHVLFDYCLNPLHLKDADKDVVVPCGKCAGCRVHAANIWSQRLGEEISSCPDSIFFTLTYNNYFLPKLVCDVNQLGVRLWKSDHFKNWYFAGSRCSLRSDGIILDGNYEPIKVTNFDDFPCIPYASKRDIQLWLKRVRTSLSNLNLSTNAKGYFRYFIISEYGETKYRPHYHGIIFPCSREISELLSSRLLYEAWKMCDKDRFDEFCVHCNSSTSNYLTTYVNSITNLPKVYLNNEVRPFRLTSKSPSIGFGSYVRDEVYEKIVEGTFEYVKRIERITDSYVMRYSKNYLTSLFPKCKGYVGKSYHELSVTYGFLYRLYFSARKGKGFDEEWYFECARRLSQSLCPSDFVATRVCFKKCLEIGCTPFHYLFLLDKVWYLNDMYALHMFYNFQQKHASDVMVMSLYTNLGELLEKYRCGSITNREIMALDFFFESFGIDSLDIKDYSPEDFLGFSRPSSDYVKELEDILSNMVKMPKLNESLGVSPVNQFI